MARAAPILKPMLNQTAQAELVFQALAIPSRRFIVDRLSSGPASVSELARPLRMSLAAVMQHLRVLEDCGIVRSEKVGRVRECRLGPATTLGEAGEWIEAHRRAWEGRLVRFGRFAEGAE